MSGVSWRFNSAEPDIGIGATGLIAYLWVVTAISMPGIVAFLQNFFPLRLSTTGLSRMMIRLANILDLLKARLHEILAWKNPNPVLKEVIAKVARQKEYVLTFVEHDDVPNHNNYGEYIIKKGVLKRKVSGGSMSEEGVKAYAILQSIAQTCHLRRLSFAGYIGQAAFILSVQIGH